MNGGTGARSCERGRRSSGIAPDDTVCDSGAEAHSAYTVYILRCEDGSLYTGITTDIERRLQEHRSRGPKSARYTRTHPVIGIEATWEVPDRAAASALEYRIKRLTHDGKLALIAHPDTISKLC